MTPAAVFDRDLVAALPALRKTAWRLTSHREAAEDLVNDTVERALRYRDRFLPGSNMAGWLRAVCLHHFLSERRKAWRWNHLGELEESLLPAACDQHVRLELKEALDVVYSRLSPEQRDAVMWRALGDDIATIADEAGVSDGTIKSRLHRGHALLKEAFHA